MLSPSSSAIVARPYYRCSFHVVPSPATPLLPSASVAPSFVVAVPSSTSSSSSSLYRSRHYYSRTLLNLFRCPCCLCHCCPSLAIASPLAIHLPCILLRCRR
ncbi:hypothetical protein GW17_00056326 [Ensete ventricosum]|nr:hypothetical protein GW17_00056326 [Ensete ventricosum]